MTARAAALVLALLPAAGAACYRPALVDCTVRCDSAKGCPSPLRCVDGYCLRSSGCPADHDAAPEVGPDAEGGRSGGSGDAATDGIAARPDVPFEALPTAISNLVLWLDPEWGVTLTPDLLWRDRSDRHNDARATGAAVPRFIAAGADGLPPTFELSGAGQFLTLPAGTFIVGMIFVVAEPAPPLPPPAGAGGAAGAAEQMMPFIDFADGFRTGDATLRYGVDETHLLYESYASSGTPGVSEPVVDPMGNFAWHLFEVRIPGQPPPRLVTIDHFKDGRHLGQVGASGAPVSLRMSNLIGRGNTAGQPDFHGRLGEIVVYDRPLVDAERAKVESYLLGKWRLPPS